MNHTKFQTNMNICVGESLRRGIQAMRPCCNKQQKTVDQSCCLYARPYKPLLGGSDGSDHFFRAIVKIVTEDALDVAVLHQFHSTLHIVAL